MGGFVLDDALDDPATMGAQAHGASTEVTAR